MLSHFPPARWLAEYRLGWLPNDLVAGITLAAYAIPVSLAYATLAGPFNLFHLVCLGLVLYALVMIRRGSKACTMA